VLALPVGGICDVRHRDGHSGVVYLTKFPGDWNSCSDNVQVLLQKCERPYIIFVLLEAGL
jgi:hypothetical protein